MMAMHTKYLLPSNVEAVLKLKIEAIKLHTTNKLYHSSFFLIT